MVHFLATVNQKALFIVSIYIHMTGYAGSQDYVGTPQTPTLSQEFCVGCEQFEVISKPCRVLARGSESVFQWDVWICVGSSAESAGSLRNPLTRRGGVPRHIFRAVLNFSDTYNPLPASNFPILKFHLKLNF